jgi:hypothetical protein
VLTALDLLLRAYAATMEDLSIAIRSHSDGVKYQLHAFYAAMTGSNGMLRIEPCLISLICDRAYRELSDVSLKSFDYTTHSYLEDIEHGLDACSALVKAGLFLFKWCQNPREYPLLYLTRSDSLCGIKAMMRRLSVSDCIGRAR